MNPNVLQSGLTAIKALDHQSDLFALRVDVERHQWDVLAIDVVGIGQSVVDDSGPVIGTHQ